jgi:hypothetical protein
MMSKQVHRNNYTPEEIRFITKKIAGRSYAGMTDLFNEHFGLKGKKKLTLAQMIAFINNHKLRNGRDGRFRPGLIPHNKGRQGYCAPGSEKGWFRPGNRPHAWCPVGTEKTDADGYLKVKVRNPRTWKMKHVLIWEKAYGKVPGGHVVIFADGNKLNMRLDNLLMVSRAELAVMNRRGLISNNGDLTRVGKSIADIKLLIAARTRGVKRRRESRNRNGGTGGKH